MMDRGEKLETIVNKMASMDDVKLAALAASVKIIATNGNDADAIAAANRVLIENNREPIDEQKGLAALAEVTERHKRARLQSVENNGRNPRE